MFGCTGIALMLGCMLFFQSIRFKKKYFTEGVNINLHLAPVFLGVEKSGNQEYVRPEMHNVLCIFGKTY